MDREVKVSVVVPVYNAQKTLAKCIESLIDQTLKELEIILINDGSTDGSQQIIDQYALKFPSRIKKVTQENGGQGKARNEGLKLCKGSYIGFLDADDYMEPTMYEKMYAAAVTQDAEMTMCDYYDIDESVCKTVRVKDVKNLRELLVDPRVAPWNKLYLAETIKSSGVIFREGLIYEDTAFYANLIPYIRSYAIIHEPLVYHINWSGSTTGRAEVRRYIQMFDIMDGIVQYYQKHSFFNEYFDELEYFYSKMLLGSSFQRIASLDDVKERNYFLMESLKKVETIFPDFRRNKYYKGTKMQFYLYAMNQATVTWIGRLVHRII